MSPFSPDVAAELPPNWNGLVSELVATKLLLMLLPLIRSEILVLLVIPVWSFG